ncbi:MAG: hypothetical protein A2Y38_19500 [Spirochaetes bacterium GWB1_59_5]|nr:MAG: hypothetical protein A2Y38_19500 [Spirochaetes bacterium GWB1_59_5]
MKYPQPVLARTPHLELLLEHARRFGVIELRALPWGSEPNPALVGTDLAVQRMQAHALLDARGDRP